MCPHNNFDIIYYKDGVLMRRCKDCQQVDLRTDWIWCDAESLRAALATIEPNPASIAPSVTPSHPSSAELQP